MHEQELIAAIIALVTAIGGVIGVFIKRKQGPHE